MNTALFEIASPRLFRLRLPAVALAPGHRRRLALGQRAAANPIARLLLGLAFALVITACRDAKFEVDAVVPSLPTSQPASPEEWRGYLVGTAAVAGEIFDVEGLVTVDRSLRFRA